MLPLCEACLHKAGSPADAQHRDSTSPQAEAPPVPECLDCLVEGLSLAEAAPIDLWPEIHGLSTGQAFQRREDLVLPTELQISK